MLMVRADRKQAQSAGSSGEVREPTRRKRHCAAACVKPATFGTVMLSTGVLGVSSTIAMFQWSFVPSDALSVTVLPARSRKISPTC